MESFKANTAMTVHWDGKLMLDLSMTEHVDRLCILISMMGVTKLSEIPKISPGTGQAEAQAVNDTIRKWGPENWIHFMCFDTKSLSVPLTGACIILELPLGRPLRYFVCLHPILWRQTDLIWRMKITHLKKQ